MEVAGFRVDWDLSCLNASNLSQIKINHHFSRGKLVNVYITMANLHVSWVNSGKSTINGPFSLGKCSCF